MILRPTCCVLLAAVLPLRAQEVSLAAGASHARYADSLDGSAGFLGARLGVGRGVRAVQLDAALSRFLGEGWAVQLAGQGTALWRLGSGPVLLGIAGGAAANDVDGGVASGTGAAGPVLTLRTERAHFVVGGSAGVVRTIAGAWSGLATGSLRAYLTPGRAVGFDIGGSATRADTARFADLSAQARAAVGPVRAGLVAGIRVGDLDDGPWGSVALAWDVGGRFAVELAAGRYPQDITGFTGGLYGQAGVRVFARRARPAPLPVSTVETARLADGRVRLTVPFGGAAERLEVAGGWTGWVPTPLRRANRGRWTGDFVIAPGAYTYALVVDGVWVLPDGVAGVDDGLGGTVAILIVP